jgi:type III secretory pathway lipoprotein EscJ
MGTTGVAVTVMIEPNAPMAESAKRLEAAGMHVHYPMMEKLRLIEGCVEEGMEDALRAIPGVAGVETQRQVGIAPPDSPVQ